MPCPRIGLSQGFGSGPVFAGALEVAKVFPGNASIAKSVGITGIQLDATVEIAQGYFGLTKGSKGYPSINMTWRIPFVDA